LKLCLDRIVPVRKGTAQFPMPPLNTTADLPRALGAITTAISKGVLSPDEGASIALLLNTQMRAIEIVELDARLKQLERKADNR
jgi:hypothetical protein